MGNPVVHFEITGTDPQLLRNYYRELFGWEFDTSGPVSPAVSEPGNYGFIDGNTTSDGIGIPGGIGGGSSYEGHAIFYVGVPDVEAAAAGRKPRRDATDGPRAEPGHRPLRRPLHLHRPRRSPDRARQRAASRSYRHPVRHARPAIRRRAPNNCAPEDHKNECDGPGG